MSWTLQPCTASRGKGGVICDTDNMILARFDGPVWDENAEQLDERDRPAALMMTAAPDLLASLRAILPYAESRAEDMLECAEECEASALKHPTSQGIASNAAEARELADKAVAAVDAAKALLASLEVPNHG